MQVEAEAKKASWRSGACVSVAAILCAVLHYRLQWGPIHGVLSCALDVNKINFSVKLKSSLVYSK